MRSKPCFLQGAYAFEGLGLDKPFLAAPDATSGVVVDLGMREI